MWYDRAKYTVNFTGKNGHYPSQGGAHFNLEELKNNATGSTERVRKKYPPQLETTTHITLSTFVPYFH